MSAGGAPPPSTPSPSGPWHRPVMVEEVVDLLHPVPPGVVVDATTGGGGHTRALLDALPHVDVLGLDQDADALAAAGAALAGHESRLTLRHARFDEMTRVCRELGHTQVSGVLFDLGVSSAHLDRADRGFSYHHEGPLDMRMDRSQALTAAVVVNEYGEDELARILGANGDERFARRIARAIVAARPLATTTELADVVRAAIPAPARRRGGHPARRSFQAIRMEVNAELDVLASALDQAIELLSAGGRCVVLAYHSGEDRLVKRRLADAATGGCQCPPGLPCVCGATPSVRLLARGKRPRAVEVASNHRAESARLRAVEKLAPAAPGEGPDE